MTKRKPVLGAGFILERGKALAKHPLFLFLTVLGNSVILLGAIALYALENRINPNVGSFLDALYWSVATMTSVGSGGVYPATNIGKVGGMLLMIFGTALFGSFTALFASILLQPEIIEVEQEMRDLEKSVNKER